MAFSSKNQNQLGASIWWNKYLTTAQKKVIALNYYPNIPFAVVSSTESMITKMYLQEFTN